MMVRDDLPIDAKGTYIFISSEVSMLKYTLEWGYAIRKIGKLDFL